MIEDEKLTWACKISFIFIINYVRVLYMIKLIVFKKSKMKNEICFDEILYEIKKKVIQLPNYFIK